MSRRRGQRKGGGGPKKGSKNGLRLLHCRENLAVMPPGAVQRLFAEAVRAQASGELDKAQQLCLELLKLDVKHAEGLHLLGIVLNGQGRPEVAASMLQRAIALNPQEAAYFSNLGNSLHAMQKLDQAVAAYSRAIRLKPGFADGWYNRANTRRDQGLLDDAVSDYKQAIRLRPDFAEAHCNLGGVLRNRGLLAEAEMHLRRGLALRPDYADATNNLAVTLQDQGRLGEALAFFHRAVRLMPENYDVQYNKAMAHLLAGDFETGWREQEIRWKIKSAPRQLGKPQWMGERLNGERVLLHHECGFGDTIQFMRFAPLAAARGASVVMDVPPNLVRLARMLPGVTEVTATGSPLPAFDLQCPMMSLGLAFQVNERTHPGTTPYVRVPEEARKRATAAVEWPLHGLRVGLVWSGNPAFTRDQFRSVRFDDLRPLLGVQDTHFYALQMGPARAQLRTMQADRSTPHVTDLTPFIVDMADTAALLVNLDLLITVDTAVAHLAGALRKTVWTMIPAAPDWRWLTQRTDTPWYPTMRLFRQQKLGEWLPLVEQLRQELACSAQRVHELAAQPA